MIKPYTYKAKVTNVHDGDSITMDVDLGFGVILKDRKMRLMYVDAPEIINETKEIGIASKNALEEKILNKNVFIVTAKDKHEMFGRYLVTIYVPEMIFEGNVAQAQFVNVNKWMVDNKFAVKYGDKWFDE